MPKKRGTRSSSPLHGTTDTHSPSANDEQYQRHGIGSDSSNNNDEPKVSSDAESISSVENQSQAMDDIEPGRYPRFMLPRASGMSTMGEIHSLGPSPRNQSPASSMANLAGYGQAPVYPAMWHEYEDQFNYFYNCHFIEQDYYDYISSHHQRPSDNAEESSKNSSIEEADEAEPYSDASDDGNGDIEKLEGNGGGSVMFLDKDDKSVNSVQSNKSGD
ncbi:hypothetical protein IW140_003979 [Coemansia sp. RSA 1813]|nr:hypothetical protein LPJ74_005162 [Coemansia sp. RSA 1843]KAJ2568341.1 hypothetical protein IW140_003979 [Coemansia sp. RSA 1813]